MGTQQTCSVCGCVDREYYASNRTMCKECVKARARANRIKRADYYRAYDRERYHENGHRAEASAEAKSRGSLRWSRANRVKRYAHNRVRRAIDAGILVRPEMCSECDEPGAIEAHHDDYTKPLDVRWLCKPCHGLHHRRYSREENRKAMAF